MGQKSRLKLERRTARPEQPGNGKPEQHHNLGDSLAILALVVALLTWALAPNFWARSIAVALCLAALAYLAFRSYFVQSLGLGGKSLIALIAIGAVSVFALNQLVPQWKLDHTPPHAALVADQADNERAEMEQPHAPTSQGESALPQESKRQKSDKPSQTIIDRSQSAVRIDNNGGQITGLSIDHSTVSGEHTDSDPRSFVHVEATPGGAVQNFKIDGAHLCNIHSWDDFLDCVAADPAGVQHAVDYQLSVFATHEHDYAPEVFRHCTDQLNDAANQLLAHQGDETRTIEKLRSQRPDCIKARRQ